MRILLLIPALTSGGAERQLSYLAAGLRARGHDVLVGFIYSGEGGFPHDIPVHRLPSRHAWSPLLIADIARLIRSWKPDVVQTCLPRMDVAGGIAAALTRTAWVMREPNAAPAYRGSGAWLRRVVGARARAVIANSSGGAEYWRSVRTFTIPNGVPAAEIAQAPPRRYAEQAPVAIYCGRLDASKNVDIVIRACAAVMAARDLVLYVCGSGRDRHTLEALARELGIAASVRFTGYVSDLWSYQRAADVALLLSAFEGDPNVVSECFAAGTPMILSDIPAHRELAGDALLVPQRDVTATAAAITRVLDDPAAARQRAERARARIGDGSLAAMVAAYEQVYAAIIGR